MLGMYPRLFPEGGGEGFLPILIPVLPRVEFGHPKPVEFGAHQFSHALSPPIIIPPKQISYRLQEPSQTTMDVVVASITVLVIEFHGN
jgi:hypothetical protein